MDLKLKKKQRYEKYQSQFLTTEDKFCPTTILKSWLHIFIYHTWLSKTKCNKSSMNEWPISWLKVTRWRTVYFIFMILFIRGLSSEESGKGLSILLIFSKN